MSKENLTNNKFILTDCCMWEMNKKQGNDCPHAIQVVDIATGQVRFIKSGSTIKFVDGDITGSQTQDVYNKHKSP